MNDVSAWNICAELANPWGRVVKRWGPRGVPNVVRSRDSGCNGRWSYPPYKSIIPYTAYPAKASVRWSVNGGSAASFTVTAFKGCRSWTRWSDFLSFLAMQNHRERYAMFEGSYTPP